MATGSVGHRKARVLLFRAHLSKLTGDLDVPNQDLRLSIANPEGPEFFHCVDRIHGDVRELYFGIEAQQTLKRSCIKTGSRDFVKTFAKEIYVIGLQRHACRHGVTAMTLQ